MHHHSPHKPVCWFWHLQLGTSPGAATINTLFPFVSPFSNLTPGLSKEADPKQASHKYFLNFMKAVAIFLAFQIDRYMYVIHTWNRVRPYGALPVQLLSLSPIPCFLGNGHHSPSLTFPEFQRTGSNSCSSGKGGKAETMEEQTRTKVQPRQSPGSSSRNIQNSIFEFFSRIKAPSSLEDGNFRREQES